MDLACASQGSDKLRDALVKAAEASGKKVLVRTHRLHGAVLRRAAGAG